MSRTTEEINKVTGTVIGLSVRLISCAVVLLLLAEGISRGYHFGYEVFSSSAVDETPGRDRTVTITGNESELDICKSLEEDGLITDGLAAFFQMKFYDYEIYPGTYELNTSMTAKEILQTLNQKPEEDAETAQENAGLETAEDDVLGSEGEPAAAESAAESGEISVEVIEAEEEEDQAMDEESEIKPESGTEAEIRTEIEAEPEVEIQID
ncbi:MAG: hypothetical protein LIO92_04645 [Clostridiales bacterium]|nr:hypothetical protein [Clostridiales bacterium]